MLVWLADPKGTAILSHNRKRVYGFLYGAVMPGFKPEPAIVPWEIYKTHKDMFVTANYTPSWVKKYYGADLSLTFNYAEIYFMDKLPLWNICRAFKIINPKKTWDGHNNKDNQKIVNKQFSKLSLNALRRYVRDYIKFYEYDVLVKKERIYNTIYGS